MTTAIDAKPPMTALDEDSIACYTSGRPGRRGGVYEAVSACGLWSYSHIAVPGTPWLARYLPVGEPLGDDYYASLPKARRGTYDTAAAVAFLRQRAEKIVANEGHDGPLVWRKPNRTAAEEEAFTRQQAAEAAQRVGEARRAIAVIDGLLVDGGPRARCACGGYLTKVDGGPLVHADTCGECLTVGATDGRRRCRTLHEHRACPDADPVLCDHIRCRAIAAAESPCDRGLDNCCGCCGDAH